MSKRVEIFEKLHELATNAAGVPVHRMRIAPFDAETTNAVVLSLASEESTASSGYREGMLIVNVTSMARGSDLASRIDAPLERINTAIITERSLGGLCLNITLENTKWSPHATNDDEVEATMSYAIKYRSRARYPTLI